MRISASRIQELEIARSATLKERDLAKAAARTATKKLRQIEKFIAKEYQRLEQEAAGYAKDADTELQKMEPLPSRG